MVNSLPDMLNKTLGHTIKFNKGNGACICDKGTHVECADSDEVLIRVKAAYAEEKNDVLTMKENVHQGGMVVGNTEPEYKDGSVLWYHTDHNEIFYYDFFRDKWLSLAAYTMCFGAKKADGQYLCTSGTVQSPNLSGYYIPGKVTLTSISCRARYSKPTGDKQLFIRSISNLNNSDTESLHSFTLYETTNKTPMVHSDDNLDIPIENKSINIYCSPVGGKLYNVGAFITYRREA